MKNINTLKRKKTTKAETIKKKMKKERLQLRALSIGVLYKTRTKKENEGEMEKNMDRKR